MASLDHIKLICSGVSAWNERRAMADFVSDFTHVDMRRIDLRAAQLRGADFDGSRFTSIDLAGATLTGARLNGVTVSASRFERADMQYAEFKGADFTRVSFRDAVMVRSSHSISKFVIPIFVAQACAPPSCGIHTSTIRICAGQDWRGYCLAGWSRNGF